VRPLAADGVVEIDNLAGSVQVIGWSESRVEITGVLGKNVEDLEIEGGDGRLSIEVDVPRHVDDLDTDLVIRVPATASVGVETVSATIQIEGVGGAVELESVSGWVKTAGRPTELDVETVSGNVTVAFAALRTELSSVSGAITVEDGEGRLYVESVSGNIHVNAGLLDEAGFETVSGNVVFAADMGSRGEFDFESMSGVVTLLVPPAISADFDVSTFSGAIENAVGPQARSTSQYTSEKELSFTAGSGGPQVSIETFSGAVKIKTR
jgi:DUF4097 and DUF4098 domain-containing protein YvlB